MNIDKYSYNELFQLIKMQTDKEKALKKKKTGNMMDDIINQGLRMINNPTLQNFNKVAKTIVSQGQETKKIEDDRTKYIYRSG